MKEQLKIPAAFRIITVTLICIGTGTFLLGILSDSLRTWANYLIVNYYFLSLALGAAFFLALQSITQSGWSVGFKRVPEAMMAYIPIAAVFFLLLFFGVNDLYSWSNEEALINDPVLQHKSLYLNVPFFFIRLVIFFFLWIIFTRIIRKISIREDMSDPADQASVMTLFNKSELFSKIFIFIFALTFSLSAFDWIMSLEPHWYSTIFAFKNLAAALLHGVSILTLIVFILHKRGYFPFLNKYHRHDFARYIFMLSIVWGYFWFAQFMIIWYGNIPEETAYYYIRWDGGWKVMFFLEIGLNWGIPFLVLLPVKASRNLTMISIVVFFLIIGQYLDLYLQIIPGTSGKLEFGWIEAGMFLGYAGLFALVVGTALTKARLIPSNHPYLEESLDHKFV